MFGLHDIEPREGCQDDSRLDKSLNPRHIGNPFWPCSLNPANALEQMCWSHHNCGASCGDDTCSGGSQRQARRPLIYIQVPVDLPHVGDSRLGARKGSWRFACGAALIFSRKHVMSANAASTREELWACLKAASTWIDDIPQWFCWLALPRCSAQYLKGLQNFVTRAKARHVHKVYRSHHIPPQQASSTRRGSRSSPPRWHKRKTTSD